MIEFLQTGKALSVFIAIGAIGIVSKLITRSLYKRLVKETDNMAMTKNKNLKILKQKLENAYRLNQNIVNTQAYLDKQIYGFKCMHISLNGWNNLSLQMTILGLLAGGACSFLSYWYRLDSYYIILYASVGALGSLFLTFLDSSFNISLKQQRLSNALLEYVDNSVFVRVARELSGRDAAREARDFAAISREPASSARGTDSINRSIETADADSERVMLARENEIRDGLVREGTSSREGLSRDEEPRRGAMGNLRNRNIKAEELLRTVRNMKGESVDEDEETADLGRARRPERGPSLRRSGLQGQKSGLAKDSVLGEEKADTALGHSADKDRGKDTEARRDIDYLKRSLEQIAASKEKNRVNDDWAKNLDAEELKVIGEVMRQYFSGN